MKIFVLFSFLLLKGVFADAVIPVSVMEGDSVTLHTDLTEIQQVHLITWTFGPENTLIAQINTLIDRISVFAHDGRFRDRLKVHHKTGSLTITNTTFEHAGLYELQTTGGNVVPPKRFSITVSAGLPFPVITGDSSQCLSSSSPPCSLLCSVVNVSDATLSWLKGKSVLSSISASDPSISLSLPLEVEYEGKHTYSCEIKNNIGHRTTHLDSNTLCRPCEGVGAEDALPVSYVLVICISVIVFLLVIAGIIFWRYRKRNRRQLGRHKQNFMMSDSVMKSVSVNVGETVTLNTGVTDIDSFDMLQWGFGDLNAEKTNPFRIIARKKRNIRSPENMLPYDDRVQMDKQTGYLTIKDVRPSDFGLYRVNISKNGRNVISKTFIVQDSSENRQGEPEESKLFIKGEIAENTCE